MANNFHGAMVDVKHCNPVLLPARRSNLLSDRQFYYGSSPIPWREQEDKHPLTE